MNTKIYAFFLGTVLIISSNLYGQGNNNCFLYDYEPKTAEIPRSIDKAMPTEKASVVLSLKSDTIGKVSKYVFGNAIAAWYGSHENTELIKNTSLFAPSLIRFPGGSWSNGYFWNKKIPADVPDSIYDGTTYNSGTGYAKKNKFTGLDGEEGWVTTTDQWYKLRENTGVSEGLITVNYGYARYGTGKDPVAQAAHLAADWVRYDAGRTKFWEIGNENGGPWEYGWMIDTALNQDGQPQIQTGELYGKHFKVFADSMRKAASEIGTTIFIGGQLVIEGETSWNFVDRTWNKGFFKEIGDSADFYLIHAYFDNSQNVKSILRSPQNITNFTKFLNRDFIEKGAYPKPMALTEYNIGDGGVEESNVNGMQAVVCMSEMIKNNFGLGARWLLERMFENYGSNSNSPHAEFYYLAYLPKFYGDHAISITSSNADILSYASRFSSGETAMVIINTGSDNQVIGLESISIGVGEKCYVYTFTGGTESDFSKDVYINGQGPDKNHWGPYSQLFDIKADAYTIDEAVKFVSPARSVQMIMIEGGGNIVSVKDNPISDVPVSRNLQNYPNPFMESTLISYHLPENAFVTLKIFDMLGKEVAKLVNGPQKPGNHAVQFNALGLPAGIYYCGIQAGDNHEVKKLIKMN